MGNSQVKIVTAVGVDGRGYVSIDDLVDWLTEFQGEGDYSEDEIKIIEALVTILIDIKHSNGIQS